MNYLPLFIALFFGSIYAFLVPPFQSPDEYNHFYRAWQVSEGHFFPEKTADMRLGGQLPQSLDSLKRSFIYLKNDYGARTSFEHIQQAIGIKLQPEKRVFIDFPNTAIYAPSAYLPQAFAVCIGRFWDFPPILILYLGRLFNLYVWVFFIAVGVKAVPFLARYLVFAALLPASLTIAASLNADVLTNGLCFWLVAALLGGNKSIYPKVLAVFVIVANKLVFAPLVLLQLADKREGARIFPILFITAVAAALFWGKISNDNFIPFDQYNPALRNEQTLNEGVEPAAQLDFILKNPLYFTKIALVSYAKALPSTAAHLVGKFGWEKNYLPAWCLALLWLCYFLNISAQRNPISNFHRILFGCTALLVLILFSVTMYGLWCPVGSPVLHNLQGRYFHVLLILAAPLLSNGLLDRHESGISRFVYLVLLVSNIIMIGEIYSRYYI